MEIRPDNQHTRPAAESKPDMVRRYRSEPEPGSVKDILERGIPEDASKAMKIKGVIVKTAHTSLDAMKVAARLGLVTAITGLVAGIATVKGAIHHMFFPEPPTTSYNQLTMTDIIPEPAEPHQRPPASEGNEKLTIAQRLYRAAESLVADRILGRKVKSSVPPLISRVSVDELKKIMKPGDVMISTDNRYPGWQVAEKILFGSDWTHAALYIGDGKYVEADSTEKPAYYVSWDHTLNAKSYDMEQPAFCTWDRKNRPNDDMTPQPSSYQMSFGGPTFGMPEPPIDTKDKFRLATQDEIDSGTVPITKSVGYVFKRDLEEFLERNTHMAIVRPHYKSKEDVKAAVEYAESTVGKLYDDKFDGNDDTKLYCSEIPVNALKAGPNPIRFATSPVSKRIPSPDTFIKSKKARVVWTDGSSFWGNLLSHLKGKK